MKNIETEKIIWIEIKFNFVIYEIIINQWIIWSEWDCLEPLALLPLKYKNDLDKNRKNFIQLSKGESIPISKKYSSEIKTKLQKWQEGKRR